MSALFTAVININLTLLKKKMHSKKKKTAVKHLVIVAKDRCYLYEMGEEANTTPRKIISELHLNENDDVM